MQEAIHLQVVSVDLARPVFRPKREVVGHIVVVTSLEGGIMPIHMVVGIKLFEAFFIVMKRIPKGIV